VLDEFVSAGLVTGALSTIKSGKEATAYLCRGGRELGAQYAVAKLYHERSRRNFANDTIYEVGKRLLDERGGRAARAIKNKTGAGREMQGAMWVDHEFETLSALAYAGVSVPEPYACSERLILMEFVGGGDEPAPQLHKVRLEPGEAGVLLDHLLSDIETMLRENVIHGDLSPYNILYDRGRPVIIDLPQAVDPRFNRHAEALLARDVANVAAYFAKAGATFDHEAWTRERWRRFVLGRL
jgi:RIO kinase 1